MNERSDQRVNLEFKARIRRLDEFAARLQSIGAQDRGVLVQRDTYFRVEHGRLKLREQNGAAELIPYERDEDGGDRVSRYRVIPVTAPTTELRALLWRHGLRGVVDKRRHLWLYQNARIHLDSVEELGAFIEFEIVDPASADDARRLLAYLMSALGLEMGQGIAGSYIDLLEQAHGPTSLPDLLTGGLDLVFAGINPSLYSVERGHYFARPSNRFWPLLNQWGALPEPVTPEDDARLPGIGIGLTDLVQRPSVSISDLRREEFEQGGALLSAKLRRFRPRAVCFVGVTGWRGFSGRPLKRYGLQDQSFAGVAMFVMPSTSGRANRLHAERLACLAEIRRHLGPDAFRLCQPSD